MKFHERLQSVVFLEVHPIRVEFSYTKPNKAFGKRKDGGKNSFKTYILHSTTDPIICINEAHGNLDSQFLEQVRWKSVTSWLKNIVNAEDRQGKARLHDNLREGF